MRWSRIYRVYDLRLRVDLHVFEYLFVHSFPLAMGPALIRNFRLFTVPLSDRRLLLFRC